MSKIGRIYNAALSATSDRRFITKVSKKKKLSSIEQNLKVYVENTSGPSTNNVVDAAKSSGHDQNPSWPELKLKDGQRAGSKKEYYSVITTYQGKKGEAKTEKYNMDFSEWKKLKKGEKIELKINFNGFAEINNKK